MTHKHMKKLLVFAATVFCLCSCTIDIEWEYFGYAEIKNKTSDTITVTISVDPDSEYYNHYYLIRCMPRDGVVKPKESFTQYYWSPDQESLKNGHVPTIITITLADGSEIVCSSRSDTSWSQRFFDSFETRKKTEWSHFQKHELVVETYEIDDELISLWRRDH